MDIKTKIENLNEILKSLEKLQNKINSFSNNINILKDETKDKDIEDLINLFNKLSENINGVLTINCHKLNLIYSDLVATNAIFNN